MTTSVSYVADGLNALYAVPFDYIDKSHVFVSLNGAAPIPATSYTWPTGGTIQLTATPVAGTAVKIYRQTPADPLTIYQAGSTLTSEELEVDSLQAIYRLQELDVGKLDKPNPMTPLAPVVISADGTKVEAGSTTLTGDMLLRGNLADGITAGAGAALVKTNSGGTGAVARTVQDKLREFISVKDFGAKGDGTTDDTAAIQAAINYIESLGTGAALLFPRGVYKITSTLNIGATSGCLLSARLIGEGAGHEGAGGGSTNVSTIQWWGATDGIMLQQTGQVSWGAMNICFDGRYRPGSTSGTNMPADVWRLDRTVSSHFERVRLTGFKATGLHIIPTTTVANDNCMFNTFVNLTVASYHPAATGIALKGNATHTANCCHNTFVQVGVIHAFHGVYLDDCDNNLFIMLRVGVRPEATDPNPWGVLLTGTYSRSNYIFHLQTNSMTAAAGSSMSIYGYDKENGQPDPVVDPAASVFYASNGHNGSGFNNNKPIKRALLYVTGDPVPANSTVADPTLVTLLRSDVGGRVCFGVVNSPRAVNLYSHGSGSPDVNLPALSFGDNTLTQYRMGGRIRTTGTSAPASGTWQQGDIIYTTTPAASGFIGWVCVTGGTPGTWKTFGAISA